MYATLPADPDSDDCFASVELQIVRACPRLNGYTLCTDWDDDSRDRVRFHVPSWAWPEVSKIEGIRIYDLRAPR